MSGQGSTQTVIDSLEFARAEQTLRGSLPLPGLTRLRESLVDTIGVVEFEVKGGHDARRRPILMLAIHGILRLQCQRCLGALEHPLEILNRLLLATAGESAAGVPDEEDSEWVEASGHLDVASLVEDEIILSLPYAPTHKEGSCRQTGTTAADGAAASAFAKLAVLKQNNN
ncbi:MAG TPA: YceD family protein [Burkholderiales bacterium]|nr:YceD family protein [Burkholderiales bacterium]